MERKFLTMIDVDTGEVFENVTTVITEKQEIINKNYHKFKKERDEFVDKYGNFIFKVNSKRMLKKENTLSNSDIAKLIYVSTFIDYDNYLKYEDGKMITKNDLKKIVAVNDKLFYKWYNTMIDKKILIENEKLLSISSDYSIKGKLSKNKAYNRIFINSIRMIYESNIGKNMSTLGHIMRMLPYINYYGNVLCWNPMESNEDKISPMTVGELSELLDEYKGDAKKFMKTMSQYRLEDGQPIMVFFNDNEDISKQHIMFNPLLTYSGKNENMKEIQSIFLLLRKNDKFKNRGQNQLNTSDINGLSAPKKGQ